MAVLKAFNAFAAGKIMQHQNMVRNRNDAVNQVGVPLCRILVRFA